MAKSRSGTVRGTVFGTIEKDGLTIEYTAKISGSYYYDPGCMYLKNGDPGYPPEEDYEGPFFEGINELTVYDADGNKLTVKPKDYEQLIQDDIVDDKDWDDCDWDDDPEPPEEDDYE